MRQFYALPVLLVLAGGLAGAQDEPVRCTVERIHLTSKSCEQSVRDLLSTVKGVSGIAVDRPGKTVTFTAKSAAEADQTVETLLNGGFFGKWTIGKSAIAVTSKPLGFRADQIVVRNVHACCEECDKAIKGLFKDSEVTLEGKGPQKDVTIRAKNLEADEVLRVLHEAGLHGAIIEPKKK
jgi:hypothetical protein